MTEAHRSADDVRCADCGGFDMEWMRRCVKHGLDFCRGCSCPACDEDYDEAMEEHAPTAQDFL